MLELLFTKAPNTAPSCLAYDLLPLAFTLVLQVLHTWWWVLTAQIPPQPHTLFIVDATVAHLVHHEGNNIIFGGLWSSGSHLLRCSYVIYVRQSFRAHKYLNHSQVHGKRNVPTQRLQVLNLQKLLYSTWGNRPCRPIIYIDPMTLAFRLPHIHS